MADIASSSSSSSVVVPSSYKYDVFLSFRGVDTRKNFTSHLYAALWRRNIEAYIDSENLERGEEISSTLLTTIEESKLSIVIFSENYASSRWCLEELVRIVECINEREHIVLPVFYGVDPAVVRHQKGSYANAFVKLEERFKDDKTKRWRDALTAAANISGYSRDELESESKLVEKIVEEVLKKLSSISNSTDDELTGLFGMDKHLKKMESLLCLDSSNVFVIGIWGMGGIGKTTLAETVCKRFSSQFEGCFFENVSEVEPHHLRDRLFSKLLGDKNEEYVHSNFANDRLRRRKKVLLVLDNITDLKQLECLGTLQFGVGSRIILTSRDKKLLKVADAVYEVEALDFKDAFELFCCKAFEGHCPTTNFLKLSQKAQDHAQGNPLALHVLGSHLHSRSLREWKSTLKKLEKAPDEKIDAVLKISYDALDDETKAIFLDIACCLDWEDRDLVEEVLGDDSHIGISFLIEKSLITIKYPNKLNIHDLLQQMAWKIVRKETKELQQLGRLFNAQDVYRVLKNNEGTPIMEVIFFDISKIPQDICLRSNVFEDMCNLRILKMTSGSSSSENCNSRSIKVPHGLRYLPQSLRYLKWSHCPLKSLPSNFEAINLVKLHMRDSKIKELSAGIVHLGNLKEIDLSYSMELIKLPDLSQASKLEIVNFRVCRSLRHLPNIPMDIREIVLSHSGIEALPSSFGSLKNIVLLDLEGCEHLKSLPNIPRNVEILNLNWCRRLESVPSNIVKVKSVEMSYLSFYERMKLLPEISHVMEHLEDLSLEGTRIQELPQPIKNLIVLCVLDSRNCENLKFDTERFNTTLSDLSNRSKLGCFPSVLSGLNLTSLDLGNCNIQEIPRWLGYLTSLTELDLRENTFDRIPANIRQLHNLCGLNISRCKNLRHLPELPPSIRRVDAGECTSLQTIDNTKLLPSGCFGLFEFLLYNCLEMEQSARESVLIYFSSLVYNQMSISSWKQSTAALACYPGHDIPKWFSNQWEGSAATVTLPPDWLDKNFLGFATCVALEFEGSIELRYQFNISTKLCIKRSYGGEYYDSTVSFNCGIFESRNRISILNSNHVCMWRNYDPNILLYLMNLDPAVEASFDYLINIDSEKNIKVKRCGIHMIYGQEAGEEFLTSQHATNVEGICQDLTLSIGSESEKMSIHECRGCFNMELQRLGENPFSEQCTIASSSIVSYSKEIIPKHHDCSSNSNNEDNGFFVSELLDEPEVMTNQPEASGTEPINSNAEESNLRRIKCFNICSCLPFLSINIGNL
ncbi:TIR-NBS-LRR-like protein [Parasponia andersonii]|uniref:ADP-ribosyl cyclase/cyclic ADP-ribose hydrolase n=1 Tax=Parasponia andersonii TaxID=3476 RepID=A0A2P5A6P7_PARAD|nr:TIR-NBS-LRR-like protein [Parasponia andersonii]